jgi:hypothetical protein
MPRIDQAYTVDSILCRLARISHSRVSLRIRIEFKNLKTLEVLLGYLLNCFRCGVDMRRVIFDVV